MDFTVPGELKEIRAAVRELCEGFPGEYWRGLEPDRYPEEFVRALTEHGWLAALIPEEYGGAGLGLTAASVILEEINASGGNSGACHAQMYTMGTILRHGVEVPADALVGEEGRGFRYILDGMNAERILIAAECIGDGRWFTEKATAYASERVVFERPIGANQGVQFPIARAYAAIQAADLMRFKAAWLFDNDQPCGPEANMAKLLASEASWQAANACLDTHGGFGFAAEYDIERKFRETRLYTVAPVSNNLILAYLGQHVLGLPRSY